MKLRWHYTLSLRIAAILDSGYVDVARLYSAPSEKPVAWFSSDQVWENSVRKTVNDFGMRELLAHGYGLFRIGVLPEVVPLNWTAIRKQSGMPPEIACRLVKRAREWGANPCNWYGSFTLVPASQWQATEHFQSGEWVPFGENPYRGAGRSAL